MNKKHFITGMLGCALALSMSVNPSFAQNQQRDPAAIAQQRTQKLTADLGLNDDQKAKVQQILLDDITKRQALRQKYEGNREAGQQEFKALSETHKQNMKSVLTPEQFTKWESDAKNERQNRRNGGGEGPGENGPR